MQGLQACFDLLIIQFCTCQLYSLLRNPIAQSVWKLLFGDLMKKHHLPNQKLLCMWPWNWRRGQDQWQKWHPLGSRVEHFRECRTNTRPQQTTVDCRLYRWPEMKREKVDENMAKRNSIVRSNSRDIEKENEKRGKIAMEQKEKIDWLQNMILIRSQFAKRILIKRMIDVFLIDFINNFSLFLFSASRSVAWI